MFIIDYLFPLVKPCNPYKVEAKRIEKLKRVAEKYDCVIITASSPYRVNFYREGKET